jgi:hypothetical protein
MSPRVPILSHVEVAVGQPQTVLNLDVHVPLALQECHRSDPVSLLDVVLQGGHLLGLHFVIPAVLGVGVFDLGLGD